MYDEDLPVAGFGALAATGVATDLLTWVVALPLLGLALILVARAARARGNA